MCLCSEYKEADNLLYILMECGELDFDKYLKDTIKQEGHLSPLYIKFYWQSMLQAVGALHKEGQWGLCDVIYWDGGWGCKIKCYRSLNYRYQVIGCVTEPAIRN